MTQVSRSCTFFGSMRGGFYREGKEGRGAMCHYWVRGMQLKCQIPLCSLGSKLEPFIYQSPPSLYKFKVGDVLLQDIHRLGIKGEILIVVTHTMAIHQGEVYPSSSQGFILECKNKMFMVIVPLVQLVVEGSPLVFSRPYILGNQDSSFM